MSLDSRKQELIKARIFSFFFATLHFLSGFALETFFDNFAEQNNLLFIIEFYTFLSVSVCVSC